MARRAALQETTRQRVIDAAVALHAKRGMLGTKPADVAAEADVTLTTFYKHFPDRGSLVVACTARAGELKPPPDLGIIRQERTHARRLRTAVRLLFDYYAEREPWIYAGRTEERYVPEVGPVMVRLRDLRDAVVEATLGPRTQPDSIAASRVLLDFWSWRLLCRDVGLHHHRAIDVVVRALQTISRRSRP
jgi:AcrR family transcriptional regulator